MTGIALKHFFSARVVFTASEMTRMASDSMLCGYQEQRGATPADVPEGSVPPEDWRGDLERSGAA
jgi:hypothetical protein